MSVSNSQKTVSPAAISCQGTAAVTLSFDAAAELFAHPADIVLIMDRSYSMNAQRMVCAKKGAENLISMVAAASTGDPSGDLADSRIGIVSFASTATAVAQLTTDCTSLKNTIAKLAAGGETNHEAAFKAAETMLGPKGTNRQIAVMFTDGITTVGGDAAGITDRMKAAGIEIYCIGLVEDPALLNCWASDPIADHVSATDDEKKLEALFRKVASRAVIAGAQNVIIRETVSPDFRITAVNTPSFGTARLEGERNIVWTMDYAGVNLEAETYALSFEITHVGSSGGSKTFNASVLYEDQAGTQLEFPNPVIEIACGGIPVYPEPCPEPTFFDVPHCKDAVHVMLRNADLLSLGRIIQVDATIQAVCPGKRVAVSIILNEIDPEGTTYPRGVKHVLIPAQTGEACRDITLKCIPFSVPEVLDSTGHTASICNSREFQAQVIANYVDTDFACCEGAAEIL